jgi:hypothetical protein
MQTLQFLAGGVVAEEEELREGAAHAGGPVVLLLLAAVHLEVRKRGARHAAFLARNHGAVLLAVARVIAAVFGVAFAPVVVPL